MSRWYSAQVYNNKIIPIEVTRETANSVYIVTESGSRLHYKISDGIGYFPSHADAKAWLAACHQKRVDNHQSQVAYYTKLRSEAEALTE